MQPGLSEGAAARTSHVTDPQVQAKHRLPWKIFWTALVVRLLWITLARTYRFDHYQNNFLFGWEAGRIGQALAKGFGYSDVFANDQYAHTGPTAWLPPLYPLLVGAVFKVCGVYSHLSGWVLLAINCVFSASTVLAVYLISRRCFSSTHPSVALWSAWIWALYPSTMKYTLRWVWEMTITTAIFAWIFVLALHMRGMGESGRRETPRQTAALWSLFGILWAAVALLNPSLLLFLPVCGVCILLGAENKPRAFANAVLSALVFLALLAPWTIRNERVFHQFIPLRGNFGVELALFNNASPEFGTEGNGHPWVDPEALRTYVQMGEPAYARMRGAIGKQYIVTHPVRFLKLSGMRFYFFWVALPMPANRSPWAEYSRIFMHCFGSIAGILGLLLALRNRVPAAGLMAWAFFLLPLTYYFISAQPRFRHPLEPLMVPLAVYLFQSAQPGRLAPAVRFFERIFIAASSHQRAA